MKNMICVANNMHRNEAAEAVRVLENLGYVAEARLDYRNRTSVFANVRASDWAKAKNATDYPQNNE